MTNIIRAEFLKSKRTMSSKLIVVFPIITLVMAFVLTLGMTNAYAESAWNWWYVLLLPGMIAIVSYLSVIRAAITVVVLTITELWQIPLFLFLSEKFGMVVELMVCLFINVLGIIVAPSEKWFILVSAISMRVVTPLLHVLPNGLRAQAGEPLLSSFVILPGILIALAHFMFLTYLYLNWFEKREVK